MIVVFMFFYNFTANNILSVQFSYYISWRTQSIRFIAHTETTHKAYITTNLSRMCSSHT